MEEKVNKQLRLGNLILENFVIYSPLAGVSDFPFRKVSARYKPGLMYCEMTGMEPIVRGIKETYRMLDYEESMRPIGAQICGSDPALAGKAAKIVEDLGFDVVDLNCGCPVDKVTKKGCGSAMLKEPERIGEVISQMVAAVKIPVTIKVRAGWDDSCINAPLITQIAEQAGAKAIFVHGRTRQQAYRGGANWAHIKACKEVAKEIIVIGNGDIFSAEAAMRILGETHCDGVLVSRGTMGQPWLVEDILAAFKGQEPRVRTVEEKKELLLAHFDYSAQYKDERGALVDMRKIISWYVKNLQEARLFRKEAMEAQSTAAVRALVQSFHWQE
jgi:nifR3 family TIM-barrel protein